MITLSEKSINVKAWIAEMIATFTFVLIGTLSVIVAIPILGNNILSTSGLIVIALAHGLAISVMIYTIGHISGGHINPAVTIAMLVSRKINLNNAIGYITFQIIGAVIASVISRTIFDIGSKVQWGLHQPGMAINGNEMTALFVEIILTFFLVFTIFGVTVSPKANMGWAGFAIGFMVVILHFAGVPISGASMNPARSFGPALISGNFNAHWIYWIGPIIGGIIASLTHRYALKED